MKLRCPVCEKVVSLNDEVNLTVLNTIVHQSCDLIPAERTDSGIFNEIISKYPFLND